MLPRQLRQFLFRLRRWLLGRLGKSQTGWRAEPRIHRHPGPVAEQTCYGAVPFLRRFSASFLLPMPRPFHLRRFPLATTLAVAFLFDLRPVSADLTPSR
jgi:hypothetical protein